MADNKLRRAGVLIAANVVVVVVLLLLLEGGASAVLFLRDVTGSQPVAERLHTIHDPLLGWVNEPGVSRPDIYGPGIGLTTNAQGFRGTEPTPEAAPAGRRRVVCAGDSFTLGYGVRDSETWCARLEALDPGLQTVNMGQGGYGFGQAYLWYRRDGAPLDHDVQILAFITDDFRRMGEAEFLGYPKPLLSVRDDTLAVENVPVPAPRGGFSGWANQHADALGSLRTVEFLTRLVGRGGGEAAPEVEAAPEAPGEGVDVESVVRTILQDLQQFHAERGTTFIAVLLPTATELEHQPRDAEIWNRFFEAASADIGFPFVDLFPAFRAVPEADRQPLFLMEHGPDYPWHAGHYSPEGNDFAARAILAELERILSPGEDAAAQPAG